MTTLAYSGTLTTVRCWCGTCSAIPTELYDAARENSKQSIYCPLGHSFHFAKSRSAEVREELEREQQRAARLTSQLDQSRAAADYEKARANGYKGALTKTKKRVGKGVCPACNRHFADVERHMGSKHPHYAEAGS